MYLLRQNIDIAPYYIKENCFNDEEIEKIKEIASSISPIDAHVGVSLKDYTDGLNAHLQDSSSGKVDSARRSILRWIELNENTNWLFKKIIKITKEVNAVNFDYILTFLENLQFTEYNDKEQGMYVRHNDCGDPDHMNNSVDIRKISFTIQLSDETDYEGGDFILYNNLDDGFKKMTRKKGSMIFFHSNIEHEVTPVTKGVRYSLVSWVNGPNLR
jgi:PKHD-type hydroxylase